MKKRTGPSRRHALAVLGLGGAGAAALAALHDRAASAPLGGITPVSVRSSPIRAFSLRDEGLRRFGSLDFIGGLELTSGEERFGGWSGLAITPDGRRLTAVSDRGTWLGATLDLRDGVPAGLSDVVLAPILGPDGQHVSKSRRWDTESLAIAGGVAYVGVERTHEILRFPIGRDGFTARAEVLPRLAGSQELASNQSFESVAILNAGPLAGAVIAIAERPPRRDPDRPTVPGWFVTGPGGQFEVVREGAFDPADATVLPDGDLVILERSFAWLDGVGMRIRRVPAAQVRPGARLVGEELIRSDMRNRIDNMEGIAAHRDRDGATVLTLISDDNFSMLQRTLLLQFRIAA